MADGQGALFDDRAGKSFREGRTRSIHCRWCDSVLLLRIPSHAFLCGAPGQPGCDWAPAAPDSYPPSGFSR